MKVNQVQKESMGPSGSKRRVFPSLPVQSTPDFHKRRVCISSYDLVGPIRNGGIGTAFTSLAEALASAGHEVTLLYLLGYFCENQTIDYWIDDYRKRGIRFVPLFDPPLRALGSTYAVKSYEAYLWLKEQDFDIIHFAEWKGAGYFCELAKHQALAFPNTLLCVQTHSPLLWHKFSNSEYLECYEEVETCFLEKESVRLADIVISPSQYLLNWMIDEKWKLPEHCYVQQYVIPGNILQRGLHDDNSVHRIDEIVFFGRLEVRKGLNVFCDALDQLALRPQTFRVSFLGKSTDMEGRPSKDYIMKRAGKWPWPVSIQTDLDQEGALCYLKNKGRLAVMPSLADNLPNTVLECLAANIPFIASNVGGIPEMIRDEDKAHTCFIPRRAQLAETIRRVIDEGIRPARLAVAPKTNVQAWDIWHQTAGTCDDSLKQSTVKSPHGLWPLVSVCITHHNRHKTLHNALETIRAQDYPNYEVIVVDDGSDDPETLGYLAWLESDFAGKPWRLLRQENRYLGAARNHAVRKARGEFILFMDDDNHAKPNELSTFVGVARRTGAAILTCQADLFTGNGPENGAEITRWLYIGPAASAGVFQNRFGDANSFVRRDVFDKIGGFHEEHGVGYEDWEFFGRAVLNGLQLEVIPEALHWYRRSSDGMCQNTNAHANRMRSIRPYLETLPDSLREMVFFAQGLYARSGSPSKNSFSEERINLKALLTAGEVLVDIGQREAARRVLAMIMEHAKEGLQLDVVLHALLGAAVILIALSEKDTAMLLLLNARKIAEDTKNPEAARQAKEMMDQLAV